MPELPEVETVRRGLAPVMEGDVIARALREVGSIAGAARALGVDRNTLKRKLGKYGLRS